MTEGRRQLIAVLQRTQARYVAARCRVTPSAVSLWVAGIRRPSERSKIQLAVNYGIPMAAWALPRR
jgi:transcriptional regulator with XRE-family HTH domain